MQSCQRANSSWQFIIHDDPRHFWSMMALSSDRPDQPKRSLIYSPVTLTTKQTAPPHPAPGGSFRRPRLAIRCLLVETAGDTKADEGVPGFGPGGAAARRPAARGGVAPTTAPVYSARARAPGGNERISPTRQLFRGTSCTAEHGILNPLPHVPMHVVQPECIRLLPPHFMGVLFVFRIAVVT